MAHTIPVLIASLIALTFLSIGCLYIVSPAKMIGSFGLKTPATDAATLAWLRLKGIRGFACALVLAVLLLTTALKTVGIVLIVLAVIPSGDMANVLASGGRKSTALSVHGLTCLLVLATGLWMLLTR